MQAQAVRFVMGPQGGDRIIGYRTRRRHLRERPAIGPPEVERVIRPSRELIALLVEGPVMAPTEQHEVPQRGRPARGPVAHVMSLPDPHPAAREAATAVPMH